MRLGRAGSEREAQAQLKITYRDASLEAGILRGHLAWWLGLVLVITALKAPIPDCVWGPTLIALVIPGGIFRICFWIPYLLTTNTARVKRLRFYAWWSRGWLPLVIILLPALLLFWNFRMNAEYERAERGRDLQLAQERKARLARRRASHPVGAPSPGRLPNNLPLPTSGPTPRN